MDRFFEILFYVGAVQGFILSFFLFSLKANKISNKLLGFLTLFWGLVILQFPLQDEGLYRNYPHFLKTFSQLLLTFFPLFYLHIKYLLSQYKTFRKRDLLHFIPLGLSIILYFNFYFLSGDEKISILRNRTPYYEVLQIVWGEVIAIQGIVYSILSLKLLSNYRKEVKKYQSNVDKVILKVLYTGTLLSLFSWIIGTIGINLEFLNIDIQVDLFVIVYLIFVVIIYIISYVALTTPEIFKLEAQEIQILTLKQPKMGGQENVLQLVTTENEFGDNNEAFHNKKDNKPSTEQLELNKRLMAYMKNEKPYLNPELSLQELSDNVEVTRHQLSSIINQIHHMNFYEFVNLYRIDEVKRLMEDPKNHNLKLISIAYDAGFNSKASFNRIFKQKTNMTPSQYFEHQLSA